MFTQRKKFEILEDFMKYHKYEETHVGQELNKVNIISYYTDSCISSDIHEVFKLKT